VTQVVQPDRRQIQGLDQLAELVAKVLRAYGSPIGVGEQGLAVVGLIADAGPGVAAGLMDVAVLDHVGGLRGQLIVQLVHALAVQGHGPVAGAAFRRAGVEHAGQGDDLAVHAQLSGTAVEVGGSSRFARCARLCCAGRCVNNSVNPRVPWRLYKIRGGSPRRPGAVWPKPSHIW